MKKKQFHVMGDPELDLIFSEAYRSTLRKVERREREKEIHDHIDAMAELFEQELSARDLTQTEKVEFVRAFKRQIEHAERDLQERREESRRLQRMGAIIFAAMILFSGLVYVGVRKPFTPLSAVEAELAESLGKVESGYGGYADDYFRTLDKYKNKLGQGKIGDYEEIMHAELEEQFQELLVRVEEGEAAYYDDARKWAGYFPDKEERKARRQMVDNAMAQWLGRTVDESVDKVLEGAKDLLEKVTE